MQIDKRHNGLFLKMGHISRIKMQSMLKIIALKCVINIDQYKDSSWSIDVELSLFFLILF